MKRALVLAVIWAAAACEGGAPEPVSTPVSTDPAARTSLPRGPGAADPRGAMESPRDRTPGAAARDRRADQDPPAQRVSEAQPLRDPPSADRVTEEPKTPMPGKLGDGVAVDLTPEPPAQPEPPVEPAQPPAEVPPAEVPSATPGSLGEGVGVDLVPALPEPEPPSRERRRMDIDQIDASFKAILGLTWTEMSGNAEQNQFEVLARTLGKPDYVDLTSEDLEPSALFLKFLDDAARSVCAKAVEKDLAAPEGERVLMIHAGPTDTAENAPAKIDQNLLALLLRFHGRKVAVDGPEMQSWRWLWVSAEHMAKDPVAAWRTVCIGLVNHPDFFTY